MNTFGERLRDYRVATGATQEELGFVCNVTKASIHQWESNACKPSFHHLCALRSFLHITLDELVCDVPPENESHRTKAAAEGEKEKYLLGEFVALRDPKKAVTR